MATRKTQNPSKSVEHLTHGEAKRKNIPTVEHQSVMQAHEQASIKVKYPRGGDSLVEEKAQRNPDLDPQLVWRGKDQQDWSDLVVNAPPLYIQEKVKPKVLIDDLRRHSEQGAAPQAGDMVDMFGDFNGLPEGADRTEFYQHEGHWQNRMILGDSLQVMASLAEREGLRDKVQCIYFDPPYGIKFNSNFQWSTTSRDVKDGNADHITREPEQVKAFRDTWRDGIHSYLNYLRDRLMVARDLLAESGSIFVQIGDENVHRVRAVLDEVFGDRNFVADLIVQTTTSASSRFIDNINDHVLWYARDASRAKYRPLFSNKEDSASSDQLYRHVITNDGIHHRNASPHHFSNDTAPKVFRIDQLTSQTQATTTRYAVDFEGKSYGVGKRQWATPTQGMNRLKMASRVIVSGASLAYVRCIDDYPVIPIRNLWADTGTGSFTDSKVYVVQTNTKVVQRC